VPQPHRCKTSIPRISVRNSVPPLVFAITLASRVISTSNRAFVFIRNALDALAAVLFLRAMPNLRPDLVRASRIPIGQNCLASFQPITVPLCDCCGYPFISQVTGGALRPLCRLCRLDSFSFARARSYAV
jgi:hypothetical protein